MRIELSFYGSPLKNNKNEKFYNVNIQEIQSIEHDIDMIYINYVNGNMIKFRFTNKRFAELFKRRLENGY